MKVINIVIAYFKKHILVFLLTLLIIALTITLALIPPQILRIIVDEVIPQADHNQLLLWALLYMSMMVSVVVINFIKEILLIVISQGIGKNLRLEMLKKVNHLSFRVFKEYDTGKLEAYFSNDVEEINTLITSGVISISIDLFKVIGIVVSIFIFSYLLGIITLLVLPLIAVFTLLVRKGMFNAQRNNRKLEGNVNNTVLETIDNISTIKSYRVYEEAYQNYEETLLNHFKTNQKANFFDAFFSPVMQMLKFTVIVLILLLTGINSSWLGMTIGMIVSSIDLITSLFSPIESLGMEIQTIQKSMAAIHRVDEFLALAEDEPKETYSFLEKEEYELVFDDVTFSYDGKENVIEHFSLKLKGNERLTLKGHSGSGKSTLFRLAYGLIKPTSGRVTINGMDTYLLPNSLKRKLFSVVYQDYFFSSLSIKEELTLKESSISDEKVKESLKEVGLDRIQDIHAPFHEHDYSTGELSLFNIARAILLDSKILFLDEMNAKVDPLTASKVMAVIDKISKDKMVLSINHYGELLSDSRVFHVEKPSK